MKKRKVSKNKLVFSNKNFVYDNYLLGIDYLKKSWMFILAAVILIVLSFLVSYFGILGIFLPGLSDNINNYVIKSVQELINATEGLNSIELTMFIMSNNIKTAFLGMLSGIFFTVSSVIIAVFNGYVLGFVAERAVNSPQNSEGIFVLWRLLPHGIFEIPAILISIGLGIKLGLYPFSVRERWKGFLSLLVSFVVFSVLSMVIMFVLLLFINPLILFSSNNPEIVNEPYDIISLNPAFSFAFFILIALGYVLSILIGLKILSFKDRNIVKRIIADSFRVFVFVIIPLLVIAGIIEGLLIALIA